MRYLNLFSAFWRLDWILISSVILLSLLGLASIYSANLGIIGGTFLTFKKQLLFLGGGLVFLFLGAGMDYRILKNYTRPLYFVTLAILLFVLFFGSVQRGTRGWLNFGVFSFQIVEWAKLVAVVFMASYLSEWARLLNQWRHVFTSGVGVFLLFVLVFLQPDFGSSMVIFFLWLSVSLVSGIKKTHFLMILSLLALAAAIGWVGFLKPYQKDRIESFLDPYADPLGRGYNLHQALIATGGGGFWGKGLGAGSQSQLKFLPESQTDFIFAAISEELGFVGSTFLLVLFGILFWRMYLIIRNARDDFGLFLVLGIWIVFWIQVVINVGMNIGIMPVTGISLPFVSYGGSFYLVAMFMVGLSQSVHLRVDSMELDSRD
ncbi:MAG: hypothetical protein G01um101418_213 [Parcubacteria group bacterium Gr01-1014_18]|nr:MAG: hypothetical protein Greene041636_181 [Parcubacteria group bacterium Greene0416_36]TSC81373.1 MAG: hypothetical protein G01um101418_213 [Parcubacteria group bacterium Gr01-1014_18]TSC99441.1 MAG: hypothetical protein Greene101420_108 [Parcubacteria group bacterium Greene1014_20]TSD07640.1 MAG: hypothetical protein Greene07142_97 [Parcubacteria group bacterium Greene0714_2]